MTIYEEVQQQRERLVALRRDIHAHPELGWHEIRTHALICRELDELEIPYETVCGTGVIAVIHGGAESSGNCIPGDMVRCPSQRRTPAPTPPRPLVLCMLAGMIVIQPGCL